MMKREQQEFRRSVEAAFGITFREDAGPTSVARELEGVGAMQVAVNYARAFLWCEGPCDGPTVHRFRESRYVREQRARLRAQVYACNVCHTLRRWGLVEPGARWPANGDAIGAVR